MAFIAAVVSYGCGGPVVKPAKKPDKAPEERAVIETGPLVITVLDEKGKPAWELTAPKSEADLSSSGDSNVLLNNVLGKIFSEGKPATTFSAKRALVNQKAKTLALEGNVKVREASREVTLSCSKAQYTSPRSWIEAAGSVTVSTKGITIGPFNTIRAKKDMSKIGTPDQLK